MPFTHLLTCEPPRSPARGDTRAWLDVEDGSQARICTLWDACDAGARITVAAPAEVPQEFSLLLSADGRERRRCRVIWRSDEQICASYAGAPVWSWTA